MKPQPPDFYKEWDEIRKSVELRKLSEEEFQKKWAEHLEKVSEEKNGYPSAGSCRR